MNRDVHGGCHCGAVRYAAKAPMESSEICHCQSCRRTSAAPVMAWVTFQKSNFRFTNGEPASYRSSPTVVRQFCAKCGTPVSFEREDFAGTIDITTCSLDEPSAFPPTHHAWLEDDLDWVVFGDGLPTFRRSRGGESS